MTYIIKSLLVWGIILQSNFTVTRDYCLPVFFIMYKDQKSTRFTFIFYVEHRCTFQPIYLGYINQGKNKVTQFLDPDSRYHLHSNAYACYFQPRWGWKGYGHATVSELLQKLAISLMRIILKMINKEIHTKCNPVIKFWRNATRK